MGTFIFSRIVAAHERNRACHAIRIPAIAFARLTPAAGGG